MANKNCIFFSCDRSFFPMLELCLESLYKNYNWNYDIVICHTDFGEYEQRRLFKYKNIVFLKNNLPKNKIGPIMGHLSSSIDPKVFYARFLIWELDFFQQYDKILHLDADMLVIKDLNELFSSDDFFIVKEVYEWNDSIFLNELGISKLERNWIYMNFKYTANCWMFLVPKKNRTVAIYDEFIKILEIYKEDIKRGDQSIINIRIANNNITISSNFSYNFQHRLLLDINFHDQFKDAKIIHFNGIDYQNRLKLMDFFLANAHDEKILKKYLHFYDQLLWVKR